MEGAPPPGRGAGRKRLRHGRRGPPRGSFLDRGRSRASGGDAAGGRDLPGTTPAEAGDGRDLHAPGGHSRLHEDAGLGDPRGRPLGGPTVVSPGLRAYGSDGDGALDRPRAGSLPRPADQPDSSTARERVVAGGAARGERCRGGGAGPAETPLTPAATAPDVPVAGTDAPDRRSTARFSAPSRDPCLDAPGTVGAIRAPVGSGRYGIDLSAVLGWPARGISPSLRGASRPRLRR